MSKTNRAEAFVQYHQAHPEVYIKLREYANEMLRLGIRKIGIDFLICRIRWFYIVEIRTEESFKIDDRYGSFYARLMAFEDPRYIGLFNYRLADADYMDYATLEIRNTPVFQGWLDEQLTKQELGGEAA